MNNLLSYCRLVDAGISASDKNLPVLSNLYTVYEGSSIDPDSYEVIRIIIWARESVFGRKPPGDFCIAVCELAGQVGPNS